MNNTCTGCGENLTVSGTHCDDPRCRDIARLEGQVETLKRASLSQSVSLIALRRTWRDLIDTNTNIRIPVDCQDAGNRAFESLELALEFAPAATQYYTYLTIAKHAQAAMLAAREELEAA